ncbi:wall-associated receptor kinase 17-like isoform X2 [Phragmites australis]|uniref:wall-associated receptor kinase 17-like isoform X2 n=1 Tax=Phragmites australis TaxID=29695 RepID=UPI002D7667DE|nr:wall-associated receptor kinase 17-like isoform X2 [Phragmites australis]
MRAAISRRVALFTAAVAASVLLRPQLLSAAATVAPAEEAASPGCTRSCGNISIPYPFGVEPGCYIEAGFNLTCDRSHRPPRLFLGDGTVQVFGISVPNGTVRVNGSFLEFPSDPGTRSARIGTWSGALGEGGPYTLASERNRLLAFGCDVLVILVGDDNQTVATCSAFCNQIKGATIDSTDDCSGVGCCQAKILLGRSSYGFQAFLMNGKTAFDAGAGACIAESEFSTDPKLLAIANPAWTFPAVLEWRINRTTCHGNASSLACRSSHSFCKNSTLLGVDQQGHLCHCAQGYQGNPYIPNGCYDVNECDFPETYPCYGVCNNTEGGYRCNCLAGFEGNASVPNGCKDIDECAHPDLYPCHGICTNRFGTYDCRCNNGAYGDPFTKEGCNVFKSFSVMSIGLGIGGGTGLLLLALAAPFIMRKIKHQKINKMKERFFKQNHGLLLQQLISQKSDIGGRMIITLGELEKATNNFDASHEVGGGGHGVVYKGLLDLQVVAIKKSKIVVQREIDDFINEVAILSQINHRNVVKLLGCCLETEVPILVYEFISNGTLAHHLHVEGPISLSWDERLRIALEISKALAYLHSATSTPILHRDIKSSNILLDDNLTAKVSDFGASKYIPIDQTGVSTAVQA